MFKCMGKKMQGKEIIPQAIGKVKESNFYVPNCPDYEPKVNIPKRVRIGEVLTSWHCRNCKNLKVS